MHGYSDGFGACSGRDDNDNSNDDDEDENLVKNLCIEYGILCHGNMTRPGCPTGPAFDLVLDECDLNLPFSFGNETR